MKVKAEEDKKTGQALTNWLRRKSELDRGGGGPPHKEVDKQSKVRKMRSIFEKEEKIPETKKPEGRVKTLLKVFEADLPAKKRHIENGKIEKEKKWNDIVAEKENEGDPGPCRRERDGVGPDCGPSQSGRDGTGPGNWILRRKDPSKITTRKLLPRTGLGNRDESGHLENKFNVKEMGVGANIQAKKEHFETLTSTETINKENENIALFEDGSKKEVNILNKQDQHCHLSVTSGTSRKIKSQLKD